MKGELSTRRIGRWRWEATIRLSQHAWSVHYARTRRGAVRGVRRQCGVG